MALDNLVRTGHPILFGLQLVVVFIELILTALLASHYNDGQYENIGNGGESKAKFLLFCSVWSFVFFAFYLVGTMIAASNFLFSIASHTVFLALTWIFWLAGAAAWSAFLDGFTCSNNDGLVQHCQQISCLPFSSLLDADVRCTLSRQRRLPVRPSPLIGSSGKLTPGRTGIEWIILTLTLVVILFVGARAARSGSGFGGAISEA